MGRRLVGRCGRIVAVTLMAVSAAAGCGTNPAGPVLDVQGTYAGDWTFDVFIDGVFVSRVACPGSITLAAQEDRTFGGAFVVKDEGDCVGISPISGDVLEGSVRADGGVNFQISRIPVVGAGVAGCSVLVDVEAGGELNGAVEEGELSVFTTAGLDCGDRGQGAAQITMTGIR